MKRIGGNTEGTLERLITTENAIGESVRSWESVQTLRGFLDLLSETKTNASLSAFVADSSHVFVCDHVELPQGITPQNSRFVCDGKVYEVEYIDDPMGLHYQLEVFLKYSGWQNGR